jgi:hypothetical protein
MHDERNADTTPLNPPDLEGEDKARQLAGDELYDDKDPVIDSTEVDVRQNVTGQMIYQGELGEVGSVDLVQDEERLELLEDRELRSGETDDPFIAAEEGLTYVAPVDPPVVPSSDPQGAVIAAGFGSSASEDPFDANHHSSLLPAEDEMTARVREALLGNASTTQFAESIEIDTEGGTVYLRGVVDDVDDSDNLEEVVSQVSGVTEVIDETDLRE